MRGTPPPPPPRPAPPQRAQARPEPPHAYAPPRRPPAEARAWHGNNGWRQQPGTWSQHNTWQEHRSNDWQTDHRSWAQRGGYGGVYIPADRFRTRFGSRHTFRLHSQPVIENGYPRFRYGGYSFLIVDPWPSVWGDNWYDSDDVYIEYDSDGYYLHDRRSPEIAVALTVVP